MGGEEEEEEEIDSACNSSVSPIIFTFISFFFPFWCLYINYILIIY